MFAFHTEMVGAVTAAAERIHDECTCATATITDEHGGTIALDVESRSALEAIGWAILAAAEALPADPPVQQEGAA